MKITKDLISFIFFYFLFMGSQFMSVYSDQCLYYRRFCDNYWHSEYNAHDKCFIFIGSSDFFDSSCNSGNLWSAGTIACHIHEFQGLRGWSSTTTGYNFNNPNLVSPYMTTCGTDNLFGGYNEFGQKMELTKIFDVLPTHSSVKISFKLFVIDSWSDEKFEVWVDGVLKFSKTYRNPGIPPSVIPSTCGWVYYEEIQENINIEINPHTASTLTIKMMDNLDQSLDDESWGIKDFKLYIVNSCTGGCLTCNAGTPAICLTCPVIAELISGKCVCVDHFYMKTSDFVHCAICHASCDTCNGPLETNCLSCYADHKISSGKCVANTNINLIKFDLELLDQASANTWTHTNCYATDWDSECGWEIIHGGSEKFGHGSMISKTYSTNIDIPHFQAGIRYDFYMIDSWDANDKFVVTIDGSAITIQADGYYVISKGNANFRNFCGLGYTDFFEVVYRTFNHEANTLKIEMYDTLDSAKCDEAWGISNFQLFTYICDSSCLTCSAALSTNCKTCYTNAALNANNECKCNVKYYMVINSAPCTSYPCSQCNSCDSTCYTCSGPASTECLSCESTRYLSSKQCLPCTNNCVTCTAVDNCQSCAINYVLNPESSSIAKCIDYCPSKKYKDTTTAVNTCKDCDVSCETCSGPGANKCQSCTSPKYFSAATSSCESCTSPCNTCITSSTKCTSCISPKILLGSDCVDSCGSGKYVRVSDNTCQQCDPTCKECDNGSINGCNKCRDGEYLTALKKCSPCDFTCKTCATTPDKCESCNSPKYLYNNKCADTCPDGNYPQSSDNTCPNCNSNCKTCTGPNINDCKSCNDGSYITSLKTCEKCDTNCKTCEAPIPKKCLSCNTPNYLSSTGNTCVNPCPDGEYGRDLDRTCQKCDTSCQKCTGPTSKDCSNCKSDNYLYSTRCLPCDSSCKTCSGGSSSDCLSCTAPLFLSNNKCIIQCPDGKYGDTSSNQCKNCDSNCFTCSSTSTKCDTCKSTEYKTTSNTCIACDANCKTCIDSTTKCLSCTSPLFLENNKCVSKCQDGTFGDPIDNTCKTCSSPCLTCDAATNKDCTSCDKGQVLISTGECKNCDTTCLTCIGTTSDSCVDCKSALYFLDKKCLDVCPEGTYPKLDPKKICDKCDTSCLACIGAKIADCTKCKPGDYFKIVDKNINTGECYKVCYPPLVSSPRSGKCEVVCPIDQYLDKFTNVCKDCNKNCKTCKGSSSIDCTSCNDEKFYFSYSCVRECPNGYYADVFSKICKNCPTYCAICSDSATCKQCDDQSYMIVNANECSKCDQNGYYIDANRKTCNSCPNHCIRCSSFDVCYECDWISALKVHKCEEIQYIKPELRNHNASSSYLYFLAFNQTWPEYFNNISRNSSYYSKIYLNNNQNYKISIEISLFSELLFDIYIPLNKGLPISTDLIVELNPENEIFYKLTEKNLSFPLSIIPSCNDIQSYSKTSQQCQDLEIIVPLLKRTDSPLKIKLEFSGDFSELFSHLNNVSNVSITGMNSNRFNFSIEKTNFSNIFEINLKFSDYFSEMKVLNLTFILPLFLKYHPSKKLIPESISILLKPFINKDDNFLKVMKILNFLFIPFSLFTGAMESASISFNGFISIYLIKYLRYIDISYPEEAMQIFSNEFENLISFDFVYFYFDEKDQYQVGRKLAYYNINVYVLNNGFNRLVEILCLFLIGILLKPIYFLLDQKNVVKTHFKYNLQNTILIFYFNLFIIYFCFYYLDLIFFCMVNLNKTRAESNDEIINMSISILIIVLNFIILIWFSFYLLKLHQIFKDIRYHIKNKIAFEFDSLIPSDQIAPSSSREHSVLIKEFPRESEEKQINMDNKLIKPTQVKRRTWWKEKQFQTMLSNRMSIYNILKKRESKNKLMLDGKRNLGKRDYDWRIKYYPFLQYFILWKDIRKRKKMTILYPIWNLIRCLLYSILIVIFQDHFYILASSILSVNSISLIFLIFIQPFKKWIVWGEHLFIELMVVVASLCSYLIASKEYNNVVNNNKIMEGWLILIANYMDYFFCLFMYLLNILFWIFRIIAESYVRCFNQEKTDSKSIPNGINDDQENEAKKQKKDESENIKKEKEENLKENDSKLEKEIKEGETSGEDIKKNEVEEKKTNIKKQID